MHHTIRTFTLTAALSFLSAGALASGSRHLQSLDMTAAPASPAISAMKDQAREDPHINAGAQVTRIFDPCDYMMTRCEGAPRTPDEPEISAPVSDQLLPGEPGENSTELLAYRLDICEFWEAICNLYVW